MCVGSALLDVVFIPLPRERAWTAVCSAIVSKRLAQSRSLLIWEQIGALDPSGVRPSREATTLLGGGRQGRFETRMGKHRP